MTQDASLTPDDGDDERLDGDYRVSSLELFFDLVFVFAITRVTTLLADDPTWLGMLRGFAVLAVVWWAWVGYAWLTNAVPIEDDDRARVVLLAAMVAMLVVGITIPYAFGSEAVLFGFAYLVVTLIFVTLYLVVTRDMPQMHGAVLRLAPGVLLQPVLIIVAGLFSAGVIRAVLWGLALVISFGAPFVAGTGGWQVRPSHFAERHGLIVIIALGESVVTVGLSAAEEPVTVALLTIAGVAVLISAAMWWLYFDVVSLVAERRLHDAVGAARNALARDSYSYIHGLMVSGIVYVALGLKKALLHLDAPLDAVPAVALFGGLVVYLLGHLLFRLRNIRSLNVPRVVTACVLLGCIPVALVIAAWQAVALAALVMLGLVAFEARRYSEGRARIRSELRG